MSRLRPTNTDIIKLVEGHVKSTQITLARMDERMESIHKEMDSIAKSQLKGTSVLLWIAGAVAGTVGLIFTIIAAG